MVSGAAVVIVKFKKEKEKEKERKRKRGGQKNVIANIDKNLLFMSSTHIFGVVQ